MDYGGRYSFSCGQGVKEVLKALTRSQEDSYGHSKNGSPTAGGSLEQLAIAPETPIQCTTLLRTDLNLLNEDMNTSGDNQEHCKNYKKWVLRKNQSGSEMLACKVSDTEEKKTGGTDEESMDAYSRTKSNYHSRSPGTEQSLLELKNAVHATIKGAPSSIR
ncbi:hypothetical protein OIU84_029038 [Salix udensis]|uniref:Uncharacterized protein n=1 Tax=Salix udensis TaxID=889485 RepID=A0AAD6P970_9ROSI|nr:hypothetical protein OIU84_029038 [Salix udensis]